MHKETAPRPDCQTCAACCKRATAMPLTKEEAAFIREGGTVLETDISPEEVVRIAGSMGSSGKEHRLIKDARELMRQYPAGTHGQYILNSECGYLRQDSVNGKWSCAVYTDPRRPGICKEFESGEEACTAIRIWAGLEPMP